MEPVTDCETLWAQRRGIRNRGGIEEGEFCTFKVLPETRHVSRSNIPQLLLIGDALLGSSKLRRHYVRRNQQQ